MECENHINRTRYHNSMLAKIFRITSDICLAVFVFQKFGCEDILHILSAVGFCATSNEIKLFEIVLRHSQSLTIFNIITVEWKEFTRRHHLGIKWEFIFTRKQWTDQNKDIKIYTRGFFKGEGVKWNQEEIIRNANRELKILKNKILKFTQKSFTSHSTQTENDLESETNIKQRQQ